MKTFIKRLDHLTGFMETGWGNGYVAIPVGHKLHGIDYNDIDVNVHGGLTFSCAASEITTWPETSDLDGDEWVIGFDCCHYGDNQNNCTKKYVLQETEKLKKQIEAMK